jgi:tetratricopeptide (TPR) repeat protein
MGQAKRRRAQATSAERRPRLTVCMIVRDEAENLGRALASVAGVADEVVVVDTGSRDDSAAVAAALGARVGRFAWRDDFAAARNAALEMARGAWILSLDADEQLDPASVEPLRRLVAADPDGPTVISLPVECVQEGDELDRAFIGRLASNRPDVRFARPIHEELANVAGGPLRRLVAPEVRLRHFGYTRAERERQSKGERNLRMLLSAVERWPADVRYRYYLALDLVSQEREAEAVEVFDRWIEPIERTMVRSSVIRAWTRYVHALKQSGQVARAAELATAAATRLASASIHGIAAEALLGSGRPREALEHAAAVERLAENCADEITTPDKLRAAALFARGHALRDLGDLDGARDCYQRSIARSPIFGRYALAHLLIRIGRVDEAEARLREALALAPDHAPASVLLARLERESGRLQEPVDRLMEMLAAAPTELQIRIELAECLYAADEHRLGAEVLVAAVESPQLRTRPGAFRAAYFERLGLGLLRSQRPTEALDAFKLALLADPDRGGAGSILEAAAAAARREAVPA